MDLKRDDGLTRPNGFLERTFALSAHGTTVRTELLAGLTTFLTMAYIVFVNPNILGDAGMPKGAVFVATCLVAAIGSLVMAFYANYPIALAPGMGSTPTSPTWWCSRWATPGRRRSGRCSSPACASWPSR